ncbi:cilia- and flagella-associated protein 206-like isoform X1 [Mya arenaria]|uniref:cilia- and flagella-associated protein 206-like isoform X1 n=2 Tax=Mya arenaria TaxID=6604 RepID=UPI0022E4E48D|nr:cilia- and flagella-associated protein 206-like isoform X1 [Mya arenaria]
MSRAQAESVIKNIIREIAQECASKGQAVSETLVAFMVKAVVLDPANEFNVDRTLTKDDVQKLIRLCVDRLMDSRSPALDTVKMQVYFDMNYTTRADFLDEHRRVLESRLQPVLREITDSRARTREELESLYRKIVSAVLLRSGLGSPTDIAVVREATAALQSVFPQTELGTFMSLTKRDKERQLLELTMIVTGIRLFNKECGKGGEGIDDLPAILNEAVPATTQNVDAEIHAALRCANKYTGLIEKIQGGENGEGPSVQLLKEALINSRQHEAFLRVILNDVISCAQQVEMLEQQLAARMEQLQATVQSKTAVPTAQVYPQFIHLSQLWSGFQDEMVLLSVLSNILASLDPFTRGHRELFNDEVLMPFLTGVNIRSDEQRIQETSGNENRVNPNDFRDLDWLFPETTKNFNKLPLQYRGFCAWALAKYDRLLLPANPEIGVLRYKDHYYAFSSKKAATEFAGNVEGYINQVAEGAKRSPELIQLLELHTQFATITPYSTGKDQGRMIEKPVTKCDSGTQTDTHILESNIVKSYEWNEWELRRKAIKLANLRTRVTHSMQTDLSNMRRDTAIQVWPPKEQETQTKTDSYTNVPKPSVFLAGLRGGGMSEPTVMTKMDLTIDVDQT